MWASQKQLTHAVHLQIRSGEHVNNYEITKFAQLFNDELTLDNLERIHLVNLCRFVGISPFGTDNFLVTRLRGHLYRIKVQTFPKLFCPLLHQSRFHFLTSCIPL